jgi:adenine deaminase
MKLGDNVVKDPFMLLSFMSLPVIPSLKLTDKGLVDVEKFQFTNLWVD